MKRIMSLLILLGASFAAAKDHSSEYQEGTVSLSTRSGHEIYTFTYTDGKAGDVANRDKFSADSLKMMNLVDGAPPVKVMYRVGHKLGVGDYVAIPSPDDSKKEGIYYLTAHQEVTPEVVKRAADAVGVLRSLMKDPDSFVLESVYLRESTNKFSQKHNTDPPEFCFFYRSHNSMGGYGNTGEALLNEKGKIEILVDDRPTDHSGIYYGMMTCTPKRRLADITADVKTALNPPAPAAPAAPKLTPEQEAEQAQQRADCLKLAVKNPSITCK